LKDLGTKLTKKQSKINQLQQDLLTQKGQTDDKYKIILKFAQDVYKIVQTKDDKAYRQGLMQLNQNYVMSEAAYTEVGKKKDVEKIE
jgi:thymidylate kinase